MSVNILIIEKTGRIKELEVKKFDETELYKKAGFKSADGFDLHTEWGAEIDCKKYSVSLYGKTNGRAGQENKYELPPPMDNTLFFGACVLVNKINGKIESISKSEWNTVYEFLYGGFEDIGDEDSEISTDDDDDEADRTKEGYVKDGFIVDDDEEYSNEDDSEEEVVKKSKAKTKATKMAKPEKLPTKTTEPKKKGKAKTVFENILREVETDNYLDCSEELCEEKYI
jgi:hypothetical protein